MKQTSTASIIPTKRSLFQACVAFSLLCLICSFALRAETPAEQNAPPEQTTVATVETLPLDELTLLADVYLEIKRSYVHELSDKDILHAAIKGMTEHLDPYSRFLDAEQLAKLRESATGNYAGIGISAFHHAHGIEIKRIIANSPAQKSGLLVGDFIVAIGKQSTVNMSDEESSLLLRGAPGTSVSLSIRRDDEVLKPVVVTRAVIEISSVASRMLISPENTPYAYIALSEFQVRSGHDIQVALRDLMLAKGSTAMQGLILDLRNNPGGLFDSAIEISDMFLNDGVIVTTKKRGGIIVEQGKALPGDLLGGKPMVVLINRNSASSSEIVAGALQDHKRATIIGEKSFGKGRVQTTIPMANDSAIKLTTSLYYTPLGRSIDGSGVSPDITVEHEVTQGISDTRREASTVLAEPTAESKDSVLETALEFLDSTVHSKLH